MISDTLAIVLGGGQGARLFPLTATRSKPPCRSEGNIASSICR
jgi:ADP-glucose pyrophosphorylase